MDAIVAYDLSKQYGDHVALCGLNLQVPRGTAFACVGEENSGKTTVIRLLSGLCRPTMGECTVMGLSPSFEAGKLHAVTGTVLDTARMYENLTLTENLNFYAGIHNVDDNDALDRASFLLHKLDIWEGRDEKLDDLPTGVVRRASLARALMHSPQVLLMDEPAGGLDKETADSMKELISYLVEEEGVTFLLCTRNMDYAQVLCDGFAILKQGSLLAKGDLESLRKGAGVRFRAAMRLADGEEPLRGFRLLDDFWQKDIASEDEVPKLIAQAVTEGKNLYEARLIRPGLEEIYEAYLNGGLRKAGEMDEQGEDGAGEEDGAGTEEEPDSVPDPAERPADEDGAGAAEEI